MNEIELRKSKLRDYKGKIVKHFKDKYYLILDIGINSESDEEVVIYKALYEECKVFVRPIDMFISEVDHEKYPNVKQKWRFEFVE